MQRKTKTHFHNKYQNSNEANMFDEMPKRKAKTIPNYLFLGRTGEEHLIPSRSDEVQLLIRFVIIRFNNIVFTNIYVWVWFSWCWMVVQNQNGLFGIRSLWESDPKWRETVVRFPFLTFLLHCILYVFYWLSNWIFTFHIN